MEDLLKQVLENQIALNSQFMKFASNQLEMSNQIKNIGLKVEKLEEGLKKLEGKFEKLEEKFEKLEEKFGTFEERLETFEERLETIEKDNKILKEKYEKLDIKLTNFINETRNNFSSLREELSANLDDISYIFREYDSRFAKMK